MFKAAAKLKDGQALLVLGLSELNVTRLMNDQPIRFNLSDIGAPAIMGLPAMEVLIVGGRTEEAIVEQLKAEGLISVDAVEHRVQPKHRRSS